MQPYQRAKLLAGLSRKHRAFVEATFPPFAVCQRTRYYASDAAHKVEPGSTASLSGMYVGTPEKQKY
jgi:hypothetical protein